MIIKEKIKQDRSDKKTTEYRTIQDKITRIKTKQDKIKRSIENR